jgi:hypothetical protein
LQNCYHVTPIVVKFRHGICGQVMYPLVFWPNHAKTVPSCRDHLSLNTGTTYIAIRKIEAMARQFEGLKVMVI